MGARRAGGQVVPIDLARKLWEGPVTQKARGNPEGAGKRLVVPLSSQAIAVLNLLQPFSAHSDHVFPGGSPRHGTADAERNLLNPQESIQRVRETTGVGDFQMRDIRRTVATGLGKLKEPPVTISRVLDQTIRGAGQVDPRLRQVRLPRRGAAGVASG